LNEQKTPSRLLEKKAGRTLGFVIYGSPEQLSGGYFYDRALAAALKHQGFHVQWISLEPGAPSSKVERALDGHWDFLLYDELCHEVLVPSSLRLPHGPRHIGLVHHFRYQEDWGASKRIAIQKQEKAFCKKMEAFVVNSKHTARQVTDLLQEDHLSERDQAINSGTETPLFLAYPSGNLWPRGKTLPPKKFGSLRLFFLGNLIPRKGLHRLVEALAILSEEHPGTWECRLGGAPSDSFYVQGLKKTDK
jgi:glycosyltransferase involved in cell wall biosynthesis